MQESIREILSFTDEWFELGLITEDKLAEFKQQYESGKDPNPEHYRWRAFDKYLDIYRSFDEATIRQLYQLAEKDPDSGAGEAMMGRVMGLPGCPMDLIQKAANGERKYARKVAHIVLTKMNAESDETQKK
jgi:hypothetical protein